MKSLEPEVAFWENHECKTPPRTRLCRLTPLGLGSGLIESLTSLIHRLAGAHSLATRHLVVREIVPLWRHQTVYWRDGRCDLLGKFGASLNGNNDSAAEMTSLMEMLTGLSHLDSLTMRPCGHHIAQRPLIRVRQAWCPACFRKWREEGEELYYPLIWSVLAVRVCPVHGEPLHDICSACGKHHWPLQGRAKAGYCPRCRKWLGDPTHQAVCATESGAPTYSDWDGFASQESARFIGWLQSIRSQDPVSYFSRNVRFLIEHPKAGSHAEVGRTISAHPRTLCEWMAGTQRPSLHSLLMLSNSVRVGVHQLLFQDLRELGADLSIGPSKVSCAKAKLRKHDLSRVEERLRKALEPTSFPPSSVASIARETGCHQSFIARKFPELAKAVSLRFRQHAALQKAERIHYLRTVVRITIEDLHEIGVYPGWRIVNRLLPKSMSLRDPVAERERMQTMRRLRLL